MRMIQSKLPLIVIVAPESCIVNRQIRIKVSKFLVVSGPLPTGRVIQRCAMAIFVNIGLTRLNIVMTVKQEIVNEDTSNLLHC